MPTHLFEHRAERRENRAVWFGSLAVHATLLAALGYISWTTLGRGSGRGDEAEGPMVLGLSDGGPPAGEGSAPREALEGEDVRDSPGSSVGDGAGDEADGLIAGVDLGGAVSSLGTVEASMAPLAPAPRLPLLALGGDAVGSGDRTAAAGVGAVGRTGGSRRPGSVGAQLDRLAERATVRVFGAVGEGTRFVYLFDHSTSMTGAPLAAAKRQLIGSLDALSSVHQFQVIFFNHEIQAWDHTGGQQRIPFASEANKQLAAQFLRTVVAAGGTERTFALRRALAMDADVVFFLTDADDAMAAYDVTEAVVRAHRSGTAIACIEFGDDPRPREGGNFLTRLAGETGGDYVYVDAATLGR